MLKLYRFNIWLRYTNIFRVVLKGIKSQLFFVLLFGFLPNVPLYILQLINLADRPLINLDHIILGFVFTVFLRKFLIIFVILSLISFIFDGYFYVIQMFHFNTEAALNILKDETFVNYENIKNVVLNFLSIKDLLIATVLVIIFLVWYFYLVKLFIKKFYSEMSMVFSGLILMLLLLANYNFRYDSNNEQKKDFTRGYVCFSPLYEYVESISYLKYMKPASFIEAEEFGTKELKGRIESGEDAASKILVIIVESLGVFKDDKLQQELYDESFSSLDTSKFYINKTEVNSSLYTVRGEVRELCGLIIDKVYPSGKEGEFGGCIPNLLKNKGYKTYSVHNSKQKTFNRHNWYEPLGLENRISIEFIQAFYDSPRLCRDYIRGVCDEYIADEVLPKILSDGGNQFIYWLTLDAHVPLAYYNLDDGEKSKCGALGLEDNMCRYFSIHKNTLSNIVKLLNSNEELSSAEIYIIGDHAPPLFDEDSKEKILEYKVPLIRIKSKIFTPTN